jgi:hypothetical protein
MEFIEAEQADVGPHPFFVGTAGERQILKRLPSGAAAGDQPLGLIAAGKKGVERFLINSGWIQDTGHLIWRHLKKPKDGRPWAFGCFLLSG